MMKFAFKGVIVIAFYLSARSFSDSFTSGWFSGCAATICIELIDRFSEGFNRGSQT